MKITTEVLKAPAEFHVNCWEGKFNVVACGDVTVNRVEINYSVNFDYVDGKWQERVGARYIRRIDDCFERPSWNAQTKIVDTIAAKLPEVVTQQALATAKLENATKVVEDLENEIKAAEKKLESLHIQLADATAARRQAAFATLAVA